MTRHQVQHRDASSRGHAHLSESSGRNRSGEWHHSGSAHSQGSRRGGPVSSSPGSAAGSVRSASTLSSRRNNGPPQNPVGVMTFPPLLDDMVLQMLSADEASEEALVNLYYNANERTLQWAERYLRENRAQDAADIVKEYSRGEAVDSNLSVRTGTRTAFTYHHQHADGSSSRSSKVYHLRTPISPNGLDEDHSSFRLSKGNWSYRPGGSESRHASPPRRAVTVHDPSRASDGSRLTSSSSSSINGDNRSRHSSHGSDYE